MSATHTVLYARLPGLLALSVRQSCSFAATVPVAVANGKIVRDICPLAVRCGVRVREPVSSVRRLCPLLHIIPVEELEARVLAPLMERFLDVLAAHTPVLEPDGRDAAYADFACGPIPDLVTLAEAWGDDLQTGVAPIMGWGVSRNAARACAECGLEPENLWNADARHLWPDDPAVAARLFRLGLNTYGAVAAIGESALVYQFGKMGRLLHQRSLGHDFLPVSAMYPPPIIELAYDFTLEPIDQEPHLLHVLGEAAAELSLQPRRMGRYARRLHLSVETERGTAICEWVLPLPVQQERDIAVMLRRLRRQIVVSSPVVKLFIVASDIDLPPATTGSLFDSRAAERKLALASTRQRLHAHYGSKTLRRLGEMPVPRRISRRTLWKEKQNP